MKLYWYETLIRPYEGRATVPWPAIDWDIAHINRKGRQWGAVGYDHKLSEEEIYHYDLGYIGYYEHK